jgi:hypothetical protein
MDSTARYYTQNKASNQVHNPGPHVKAKFESPTVTSDNMLSSASTAGKQEALPVLFEGITPDNITEQHQRHAERVTMRTCLASLVKSR